MSNNAGGKKTFKLTNGGKEMNWEQAYREECKKLEDVRNELKEREEQICEMQLLVDKANEKLKVHFSDVMSGSSIDCRTCDNYSEYDYDIYTICDDCKDNPKRDSYYSQSKK